MVFPDVTGRTNALELAFESKSLRTMCEIEARAMHELGNAVAQTLKHRLADLRAAASVNDLVAGRPHVLDSSVLQVMVVDLCDGYSLLFKSNHTKCPLTGADDIDWGRVSRIKIVAIEKHHA